MNQATTVLSVVSVWFSSLQSCPLCNFYKMVSKIQLFCCIPVQRGQLDVVFLINIQHKLIYKEIEVLSPLVSALTAFTL